MAFRFTLASVLKLRESLEERTLHQLEQTQHEIARTIRQIDLLNGHERSQVAARQRELAAGVSAAYLYFAEELTRGLRQQRQSLQRTLEHLQLRQQQQIADYGAARRKREVLSELRDHKREAYELKLERERQRTTDDMFLAHHYKK